MSSPALIEIEALHKRFGNVQAVDGFSLEIGSREIMAILGPNGAGKTTLIRMLTGLLRPDSGRIRFHGTGSIPLQALGICPQENVLWPRLTCLEQLVFAGESYCISRRQAMERSLRLLAELGLQEKAHSLAKKLSGGMKRRLNLALALVHDPEILVLDEPEAGLDPQSRIRVREYIRDLAGKKTILLTTHNMDEADRLADRVTIMDHGKHLLTDTPRNLKRTIGEGDLLELETEPAGKAEKQRFLELASGRFDHLVITGNLIQVKSRDLVSRIPETSQLIRDAGMELREIRLRENTLEDVFIHLTGRTLRE